MHYRLDPRTMLLTIVVLNVVMFSAGFSGRDAWARAVFILVPALLALGIGRGSVAFGYLCVMIGALAAEQYLLENDLGIWATLLSGVCGLVTRLAPGLFLGYVAVVSIRVGELMTSLERLRLPRQAIIPLAVVLRFIPTVKEQLAAGGAAMSTRGLTLTKVGPWAWLEYRLVPLIISTVKAGEELTQAALTRGLGRPGRVQRISSVGMGPIDVVVLLLGATGLGLWLV